LLAIASRKGATVKNSRRKAVTPTHPCPVCEGNHACSVGDDGSIFCGRREGPQTGFVCLGPCQGNTHFQIYRRADDPKLQQNQRNGRSSSPGFKVHTNGQAKDWGQETRRFAGQLTDARRIELAAALRLPPRALDALPQIGFSGRGFHKDYLDQSCFTFPMVDADGTVVGITCRYPDGKKMTMSDSRLGLYVPRDWQQLDGPVHVPEGPSDTLALAALGLAAIGRPSNLAGGEALAALLGDLPADRQIVVLGEYDANKYGRWPGHEGAVKTADVLAERLGRAVSWVLPPNRIKDVRAWVNGLNLPADCSDSWSDAGQRFADWAAAEQHVVSPDAPSLPIVDFDDVATVADLIRAGASLRWDWPEWIQRGVLNVIAAEAGCGKTRFLMDLIRRVRHGLPWPDGRPILDLPRDFRVLWVVSDNVHDEISSLCKAFDVVENVFINASKSDPFGGIMLDDKEALGFLEARIKVVKASWVVVDTVGNATDRDLCRQEEAKLFYQPLQIIARRCDVPLFCVTHLNREGAVLGRRAREKVRVVIQLEMPDPNSQPNRRRLWVDKSNAKRPAHLGVTMGEGGNEYDDKPPTKPESDSRPGPVPVKMNACMEWLREHLGHTPKRVSVVRDAAAKAGFSASVLYKAKDALGVEEFEAENRKWWKLTTDDLSD
jgi:hypothetical protein